MMGFGFIGAVMIAVIADTEGEKGKPAKFVIGMQRHSPRSYWKISLFNRGTPPVKAEGPCEERNSKKGLKVENAYSL
ncbi:MAG: hypothetical protein ACFFCW_03145 [Candidatus Hodarchaeota archaeon]